MTTYTTRPQDTPHLDPANADAVRERERTSPLLLGALAVALVAAGLWWYSQREATIITPTAPVVTIEPPAAVPAPADAPVATRSARTEQPRPAAVADRAPLPLAGNPMPEYPRAALRAGNESSVLLRIAIDERGIPTDVQVVERSGNRDRAFDRAAIEAARQWRFEPAMRGGKAVPATVQLPVDFRRG
ncbi:energy transducer TonB [Pseudoxanthomonas suwonensis]|uniref:TonB C-terminal domain-containing protein n=1 Tax=Pseudoxanthomonas suwonensis TaxID=314722 RepID=A0A0E3Z2P0_9GAMM|nr:energy transducer TonB [Pseudoxanthomonas suwonensis]AKC87848.1 hypothetical protein WQ53_14835 [Pseudoxanthomonas suwonensis]